MFSTFVSVKNISCPALAKKLKTAAARLLELNLPPEKMDCPETQNRDMMRVEMLFFEHVIFWVATGFTGGVIFASFFEWTLHRYFMHRPFLKFRYAFHAHAIVHHHIFKADHTYHLIHDHDKKTIPMAWWNGPLLIFLGMLPVLAIAWSVGTWELMIGAFIAFAGYYGVYEYMHWCMHLPKARRVERSWIFHRLNGHHLLHHRYMHKNYNVVMPMADLFLGTLLLRSKIKFAQARGAAVPDVQPRLK